MRVLYIRLIVICIFIFVGNLTAQEIDETLKVQEIDTTAQNPGLVESSTEYDFFSDSFRLVYSIVFLIIAFIFSIYLRQPLQRLSEHKTRYSNILKQVVPIMLMICWFLVIYFIMTQILDLSYIFLLSLSIIIGLALSIAFQDILRDVIAGLIVPFEDHIEKGNKIKVGDVYGEVYKTGFRETLIKKPDGTIVIIPNSQMIKETVTCVSAERENSPVEVDFYLPSSSDLDNCREIAHKSAIVSPYLFLEKPVMVHFTNEFSHGQSIIRMRVKAFLRKIEFQSLFISELTETVLKEIGHASDLPNFR